MGHDGDNAWMHFAKALETPLFSVSSDTKFDSGTGWPSFWAPIAKENVRIAPTTALA